jgi:hypothetical protein
MQWMSDKLPKFQNVRTLLINSCNLEINVNFQTLDRFLQNTPGLEKLTSQNCKVLVLNILSSFMVIGTNLGFI